MEPIQIKPIVEEISLAFDPANMKKFLMHKEKDGKKKPSMKKDSLTKIILVLADQI